MQYTNVMYIGKTNHARTHGKEYRMYSNSQYADVNGVPTMAIEGLNWATGWLHLSETAKLTPAKPTKLTRKQLVEMSTCFNRQEAGTHYTDMELQPLEATYLRYGLIGLQASVHTKVDKYISRKKDNQVQQLKKAAHCLEILTEMTKLEEDFL